MPQVNRFASSYLCDETCNKGNTANKADASFREAELIANLCQQGEYGPVSNHQHRCN
jgi:hypothetical protein